MPKKNYNLMGRIVEVTHKLVREIDNDNNVKWVSNKIKPRSGWVVGYRHLQEGKYVRGSTNFASPYDVDDPDPGYLSVTNTVPCLLISYWPTMNSIKVPMDGYTQQVIGNEIPAPYLRKHSLSDSDRRFKSHEAKVWPRNSKGQFTKPPEIKHLIMKGPL